MRKETVQALFLYDPNIRLAIFREIRNCAITVPDNPIEIQTVDVPNTSLDYYRHTMMFMICHLSEHCNVTP